MSAPIFVPATRLHALHVAAAMRPLDAQECRGLGLEPVEACLQSLDSSTWASALVHEGRAVAIGGLALRDGPALGVRRGLLWLLTAQGVEAVPFSLHREVRRWLRWALERVDVVGAYVDARHHVSLRWLEALGLEKQPARPVGPLGMPFHLMTLGGA